MDTSREYIEMNKKAAEIQAMWQLSTGDYLQRASFIGVYSGSQYAYSINEEHIEQRFMPSQDWDIMKAEYVWLPRQDQLQDMMYVTSKPDGVYTSLGLSLQFTSYITGNTSWNFTLEQYWLAFVISEKYGKTWNADKKEWI